MILERIRQLYPELTKSQLRLADHVVSFYHDVAFMTASELARSVEVNEATVIRFAQRLGYPGYPEFVEDVRTIVLQDLAAHSRVPAGRSRAGVFADELVRQSVLMRRLGAQVAQENIEQACDLVQEADEILVIAQGASYGHARLLANHLTSLGKPVYSPAIDSPALFARLLRADQNMLILSVSSTENCDMTARVIQAARQRGARTLCLSLSPLASCARVSEVALAGTLSNVDSTTGDSMLAAMISAFIGCIWQCVQDIEAHQEGLEELWHEVLGQK